jgi:hypothetical protein
VSFRSIAALRKSRTFMAAAVAEAAGLARWARWQPNAIKGTANVRLAMPLLRSAADDPAVDWARRWPPDAPRTDSTLQVDAAALAAAFGEGAP